MAGFENEFEVQHVQRIVCAVVVSREVMEKRSWDPIYVCCRSMRVEDGSWAGNGCLSLAADSKDM